MLTITILFSSAVLTQAGAISNQVLHAIYNNNNLTNSTSSHHPILQQASLNSTHPTTEFQRNHNTVEYRAYIGFLAFGIIMAVLFPLVLGAPAVEWYVKRLRSKRRMAGKKWELRQKERDLEAAHIRMVNVTRPAPVATRSERK